MHHSLLSLHPPGPDIQGDDDAEVEGGNGVHGLVAVQKALDGRVAGIAAGGGCVAPHRPDQAAHKEHHNQGDEDGTEDFAQPVGEPLGLQRQGQGGGKEQHGVNQLEQSGRGALPQKGGDRHLKGGTGRPWNGQAGANGKVNQKGKRRGKPGTHPARQRVQSAGAGHRHHAQDGEAHRRHRQTRKGNPGGCARLRACKGRENQVSRPEKHGKQGEPHKQQFLPLQLLHIRPPTSRRQRLRRPPVAVLGKKQRHRQAVPLFSSEYISPEQWRPRGRSQRRYRSRCRYQRR